MLLEYRGGLKPFHESTIELNFTNQNLIHGAATRFFSSYSLRKFSYIFIADFALSERTINIDRDIISSISAAAEYQHSLTKTNALGP